MKSATVQDSRWVGRILRDKWKIDRRIARGGMGTVFAATHRNNGSTAAIKVLHPEFNRDSDTRSRFLQEGYAANKVNHPGVVRILDDDVTEEGLAFLVMELLEGELLEQRRIRKGGKLPLVEVYEFADQLLDVLIAAHAQGIVHRDVKPDNIFLTREGRLKVLDFGFAQMKSGFRKEQTATGFLLGTPGFMAPEQAVGNRPLIDAQTDIWAVGATLFQLLSGAPVHSGDSAAEMLVAAANFPARSITTLEPRLPTKLSHAVDRALAYDKKDRWPDARSMQSALRAVPGRQAPKDPIRRSFVDEGERRSGAPTPPPPPPQHQATQASLDDRTVMDQIEELDENELQTGETPAYPQIGSAGHASDRDGPTVAMVGRDMEETLAAERNDPRTLAVPSPAYAKHQQQQQGRGETQRLPDLPPGQHQAELLPESTVVMDVRPRQGSDPNMNMRAAPRPAAGSFPPAPPAPRPSYPHNLPPPARPSYPPPAYGPPTPQPSNVRYGSSPEPMGPAAYAPQLPAGAAAPGASRILVFLLVAAITMVIVIFTGLLIILASD